MVATAALSGVQADSSVTPKAKGRGTLLTLTYSRTLMVNLGEHWSAPGAPETPRRPRDAPTLSPRTVRVLVQVTSAMLKSPPFHERM